MNKYIVLMIIILFGLGVYKYYHNPVITSVIIDKPKDLSKKEMDEVKKIIPTAEIAVKHIPKQIPIGKKMEETIVVTSNKEIQIISKLTNDYGWYKGLAVYAGIDLQGLDGGLALNGPYYWKIQSGALLGVKNSGLGIGYRTTSNSVVGINYLYNYNTYLLKPGLFISLGF